MRRNFGVHILLILAGYLAASVATVLVFAVFFSVLGQIGGIVHVNPNVSLFESLGELLFSGMPIFYAFVSAAPWFVAILAAEQSSERNPLWFVTVGILSFAAAGYFVGMLKLMLHPAFIVAALAGGAIGGWSYWLIAGRSSGAWKRSEQASVPMTPEDL